MYESFERFLQTAVREYARRPSREHRTRLAALLIVSGEALPVAVDTLKGMVTPGRLAAGAVGALALRVGLRWALGGPLGLVFSGLTLASLLAYYFTHQKEIWAEVARCRSLIEGSRAEYWTLQDRFASGRYDAKERDLMIDGLLQRFLRDIDKPDEEALEIRPEGPVTND